MIEKKRIVQNNTKAVEVKRLDRSFVLRYIGNMLGLFKPKLDNVDLAYELLSSLGVGGTGLPQYEKAVNDILKKITDRQEILLKVIALAGSPDTPKQRYIIAKAYSRSRAPYRKQAIEYIELYLNNGLYQEKARPKSPYLSKAEVDEAEKTHVWDMLNHLGKAYEGEYLFDKALECYRKAQLLHPHWAASYCFIVKILTKQGKLQEARQILTNARKTFIKTKPVSNDEVLLRNWDSELSVFDRELSELEDKIQRGYAYKMRKKKNI